jgi:hypothetical protein
MLHPVVLKNTYDHSLPAVIQRILQIPRIDKTTNNNVITPLTDKYRLITYVCTAFAE